MKGQPLAVYGAARGWSPQHFQATLQGYVLPASLVGMAGYWLVGLWTTSLTRLFVFSLQVTVLGVYLGRVINHRLRSTAFFTYLWG